LQCREGRFELFNSLRVTDIHEPFHLLHMDTHAALANLRLANLLKIRQSVHGHT
jgi:hypothetical protein